MNNHNEEEFLEPTLTVNRLLALFGVAAILWFGLIRIGVAILEVV